MLYDIADNGIKFSESHGTKGMYIELYPVVNEHTPADVDFLKAKMRRSHDVANIKVNWVIRSEWNKLKLFLHILKNRNDELNREFHHNLVGLPTYKWIYSSQESVSPVD